jgi:hypothetical protein
MFTVLTITSSDDQWELSDGDTLVGLVNTTENGDYEAIYMAATAGDRFEGEELGTYLEGIDAMGAVMEKFAATPHCSNCQRAHGGYHVVGEHHYCSPCAIQLGA